MNRRNTKSASRRLVASGVAGVLLAVTAGCGSGGTGTGTQGGVTTITLSMQNQNVELSDPSTWELVKQFSEANPDIKVEVSGEPQAQHLQKLTVAAQSGTLPDIFWVYGMTARAMNQEGYLLDLAPLLSEQGLTDKFSSTSLEAFAEGHAQFGLPYQALITGYFYNKAILDEHGLQPPTTFDDLLVAAKTLNAAGVTTIAQGANQSAFSVWTYLTDLVRFGYYDKIEAILAGQESFNNPDFLRLYQNIAKLAEAGAFPAKDGSVTDGPDALRASLAAIRHSTSVSHSGCELSEPFTTSKKRACSRLVIGPTPPSPSVRLSTSRMGEISAAVPVKNASSAR